MRFGRRSIEQEFCLTERYQIARVSNAQNEIRREADGQEDGRLLHQNGYHLLDNLLALN